MKVLIIGGAGMLGHQCFIKLSKHFGSENVGCTIRKLKKHYSRFGLFSAANVFESVDVADFHKLEEILKKFRPEVIVNCVGLTLRKPALGDFENALEINSMLPHRLALWGNANNCRVIHFSTDCVFDGSLGGYSEADSPSAKEVYGKTKFLGEIHYKNSITLRLSIVGRELEGKTELIEWFLSQKGKQISGFSEVLYSGLTTNRVADEVIRLIEDFPEISGLYQVSSEPISKYDLLKLVNEIYHVDVTINKNPNYKSNKILRCDTYAQLTGFTQPQWPDLIQQMKNEESLNYGI